MNINFKFLLLGTNLSLIPNLLYAQCAVTDCQQLGYTSLEKCNNGLKCPFGEYWACPKVEEKAVLGQCTGYAQNCKIGDILNNDGTCTTEKENNKTPIGVVIAIKNNCGWAMTANPIATDIKWYSYYSESDQTDITTGIGATTDWQVAITNFDACINTKRITQQGSYSQYPAAWAAINYAPNSSPQTKGQWCLPAPGILNSLYTNLNTINNTISKLGGKQLTNDNEHIWSSSESNHAYAWAFCTGISDNYGGRNQGGLLTAVKVNTNYSEYYGRHVVRPVIEF